MGYGPLTPRIPVAILRLLDELSELSWKSRAGFLGPTWKDFEALLLVTDTGRMFHS